jgi:uncharacterized membrane protein YeaQ/YmgE (transglycosylase-associated protein family)
MAVDVTFWIIFGAMLGWICSVIAGSENMIANVALGVIGALMGGLFTSTITSELEDFTIISLMTAILGSVAVLTIAQALRAHRNVS